MATIALKDRPIHGAGKPKAPSPVIAVIDVGSSKIVCLIAQPHMIDTESFAAGRRQSFKVIGVGHHLARGIRHGVVVDLDAAERSIRLAVDAAERMAGVSIDSVHVNISGGKPRCHSYSGQVRVSDGEVGDRDIQAVIATARGRIDEQTGQALLYMAPVDYGLDGARGVRDPKGMFGERLVVDLNAVTVEQGSLRNLALAVERCHLTISTMVIAAYAAGRSVLVDDERQLGVTCIDMGGGTTSIAVFMEGRLVFADAVAIGGNHITNDIARGLSTTLVHAERMKTLYGNTMASLCDDHELISVPLVGESGTDTVYKIPRSMLTGIIRPRLEETFELVRERLDYSGFAKRAGRRAVLTGGASQMSGVGELAGRILDKRIRQGLPRSAANMPKSARGPAFAVASGLVEHALKPDEHVAAMPHTAGPLMSRGYFFRVGQWIRESF